MYTIHDRLKGIPPVGTNSREIIPDSIPQSSLSVMVQPFVNLCVSAMQHWIDDDEWNIHYVSTLLISKSIALEK